MHCFDYSFIAGSQSSSLIGLSAIIADLKSREGFRKLQYPEVFAALQKKAVIESVRASNAIEGIVSTEERIKDLINGAQPLTHDEREISGYRDALNLIHQNYEHLDISSQTILNFHRLIEEANHPEEAGCYKKRDNLILEYGADGKRKIRFRPVPAEETDEAIEQMLLAYYDARQDDRIPPLLLIPCFIVDFLCIHPFPDGNGRVSRLLSVLLLYLAGYDVVRYVSLEGCINSYKDSYYTALEQASAGWHENENNYSPFILFFLQLIYRCYKELDGSFTEITLKKARKSERVEAILLSAVVPLSKAEIADRLPDVSVKTVELVLSRMMKEQRIQKIGDYKNARYMRKD